jgi:hypothetical protein
LAPSRMGCIKPLWPWQHQVWFGSNVNLILLQRSSNTTQQPDPASSNLIPTQCNLILPISPLIPTLCSNLIPHQRQPCSTNPNPTLINPLPFFGSVLSIPTHNPNPTQLNFPSTPSLFF